MENYTKQGNIRGAQIVPNQNLYLVKNANIKAKIVSYTEKSDGFLSKSYLLYKIQLLPYGTEIERRYSNFKQLRDYLCKNYPEYIIPPIPKKTSNPKQQKTVIYRKHALENFINLVISGYWYDPIVNLFFEAKTLSELNTIDKIGITRSIEVKSLQTVNGEVEIAISPEIDNYITVYGDNIDQQDKLFKKIRKLTKKVIEDNNQLKSDLEALSECFSQLEINEFKLSDQVKQKPEVIALNLSKTFFHTWSLKQDNINANLEEMVWHNFKYQSQINVEIKETLKYRESLKETFKKQFNIVTSTQDFEGIENNYGYINNQIYKQMQYAAKYEFKQLQEQMERLMPSLGRLYAELNGEFVIQKYQQLQEHGDNPLNLFCLDSECERKGLICSFCLLSDHQPHVQNVFPLKLIIQNLNKANNPKNQQELHNKGNAIFEKHHKIKQTFRQNLIDIKEQLNKLEKEIDKQIKSLDLEADLFVGDSFEKSIAMLNTEVLTKQQIEYAIEKIEPLLKIAQGHIWILRDTEINQQAEKLLKTAEILERETKYWLEKCLEDLKRLYQTCQNPVKKQVQVNVSQNRFQLAYEQWNLKETDAIVFKSKKKEDIWLSGVGLYEITSFPQEELSFQVCLFEGNQLNPANLLYKDKFIVKATDEFVNNIGKIFFNKTIKIEHDKPYSIALTPSHSCLSYYGANGKFETEEFKFEEAQFGKDFSDNSTNINQGVIPQFYYIIYHY